MNACFDADRLAGRHALRERQPEARLHETIALPWCALRPRAGQPGGVRRSTGCRGLAPGISDFDLHPLGSGRLRQDYCIFGAISMRREGIGRVPFPMCAPWMNLPCSAALPLRAARVRIGR